MKPLVRWHQIIMILILLISVTLFSGSALADCSDEEEQALEQAQEMINQIETQPERISELIIEIGKAEKQDAIDTMENQIAKAMNRYRDQLQDSLTNLELASQCDSQVNDVKNELEHIEKIQNQMKQALN